MYEVTRVVGFVLLFSGGINLWASKTILDQRRQYNRLASMTNYLITIIEEQGIELSEFDMIALKAILNEK